MVAVCWLHVLFSSNRFEMCRRRKSWLDRAFRVIAWGRCERKARALSAPSHNGVATIDRKDTGPLGPDRSSPNRPRPSSRQAPSAPCSDRRTSLPLHRSSASTAPGTEHPAGREAGDGDDGGNQARRVGRSAHAESLQQGRNNRDNATRGLAHVGMPSGPLPLRDRPRR